MSPHQESSATMPQEVATPEAKQGYSNDAFVGDTPATIAAVDAGPEKHQANSTAVESNPTSPPLDFDDLLPHVGEFGLYQKMLFLMMIPFAFYVAFVYFTQIFITLTPEEHWCWVPELANITVEQRLSLAIPINDDGSTSKCEYYAVNYTEMMNLGVFQADPSWPRKPCDQGWEYSLSEVPYETISSELDWVCENATLPTIAQAIFFVGAIAGGLLFGWLADRYGRVSAIVGSNLAGLIGGIATAFVGSFWSFAVCRFLVGMAFDNCFTMMYILVLEYVGPKWRTFVANMSIALFFTFASCLLPWVAVWLGDWRALSILTSVPLALALAAPWFLPESARWLVSQGRSEEAIKMLRKVAAKNGAKVEERIYTDFAESCARTRKQEEAEQRTYSVLDLFRSPRLRKITILMIVIWMAISLVFDGHVRNVGSLGLDLFVTFTIAAATEMPADTFLTLTLDRWGRRWLACGTMVASGLFSLLATAVTRGPISASMAIIGRFAVNIAYNIGLQYAAELLPTVVRAQGVALVHIMGYVASIVAPFIVYLAHIDPSLPLIILGLLGIFGGVLALFLPETLNHELPQSLSDGENFGKDQGMWDFPCCMKQPDDDSEPSAFRRAGPVQGSIRASIRGEVRSSMLNRSVRSRQVFRSIPEV